MRKGSGGFTLMEIVVVIAIVTIIVAISTPLYIQVQRFSILSSSREEVFQGIRLAQVSAFTGKHNTNVGIYFQTTAFTLYEGSSYATRTAGSERLFTLPDTVTLSGLSDLNFEKGTGFPSSTGTLTLQYTDSGASETITVNQLGPLY